MRVIAGSLGGRRLTAPRGRDTRPTPDRVREALFSLIGSVAGARVLDLYAGSGALAIEALSRGAVQAVLVERARPALRAIHENLSNLGLTDRATVLPVPIERATEALRSAGPFDLVLADPPYADLADGRTAAALRRLLAGSDLLAPEGLWVLEHATRDPAPQLATLTWQRSRAYGDTTLSLYGAAAADSAQGGAGEEPPKGATEL